MRDLSVIIPARAEEFLSRTIDGVLRSAEADTEVIAVLDGEWADPPIVDHPRVTLIHHATSIGQRAAMNEAIRMSTAKYVMKLDAHCIMDQGFDVKLMAHCEPDWTVVPRLYNLHAFDWACDGCGNRTYQGPKPEKCIQCQKSVGFTRVMVWKPRWHRRTDFMRFDKDLKFQYWQAYEKRPEAQGDIADTMSLLGACFFMERERYWALGGSDESYGSWGSQGTEISLKSQLSGGRLVVNKTTWYSHLFRTQQGFNFPYPQTTSEQAKARSQSIWLNDAWPLAKYPLSWLIDKYKPVPDWHPETTANTRTAGVIYYTENVCPEPIFSAVQRQIKRSINGHSLVSVSLKPIDFGNNIVLGLERGILTMFQQILAGLAESDADYVFLCEHDCLYAPECFSFTPPRDDTFYYNQHTYKLSASTGQAAFYYTKQTSGLVANRQLLIDHYRRRIERVERDGFSMSMGFEPGGHRTPRGVDDYPSDVWWSARPMVDIRHAQNLTKTRWSPSEFRSQRNCEGFKLVDEIPGWGRTKGRFDEFLREVTE